MFDKEEVTQGRTLLIQGRVISAPLFTSKDKGMGTCMSEHISVLVYKFETSELSF